MRFPSWVRQEHAWGCGPACLSMLTGVPYAEVLTGFREDFAISGIDYMQADSWLADRGYATGRKWRFGADRKERSQWPPEPWAGVHLCEIQASGPTSGGHFVLLLRDGTVMDPLDPEPKRLADYWRANSVAAVTTI